MELLVFDFTNLGIENESFITWRDNDWKDYKFGNK